MPEMIDKVEALKHTDFDCDYRFRIVHEWLLTAPTIDAEPVRRGRWKKKNGEIYCTNCKKSKWSESFKLMLRGFDFCPKCGARMGATDTNVGGKGGADKMADLIDRDALLKDMGLTDAVKYGNKDAEQQYRSYSTWMSYEIADAIWDAPAVNRWIPVEDALPEKGKFVLCACRANIMCVLKWTGTDWYENPSHCYMSGFVTHWMPLPEPPEKE